MSIKRELAQALGEEYKRRKAVLAWLLRDPQMRFTPRPEYLRARIATARQRVDQLRTLLDRAAESLKP